MMAGKSTLALLDDEAYDMLESLGSKLENLLVPILEANGNPFRLVRVESLFWFSPGDEEPPRRADQIPGTAGKEYADLHKGMLDRGYMLAPSAYEVGFLSTAHTEEHISGMAAALEDVLPEIGE